MGTITRFAVRSNGRDRSVVRTAASRRAPVKPDLASLKKADLVEMAEAKGVDTDGTKADLVERLESADG